MSAPSRSARLAISFMKLILVAEHAVGGVLGELGRAHVHHDQLVVVAVERGVDLAQQLLASRSSVGADDDPVGSHAVGDRGAFLEELRVGDRRRSRVGRRARPELGGDRGAHLVGGADRHRRLVDHDLGPSIMLGRSWRRRPARSSRSAEPSSSGGVPTAMNDAAVRNATAAASVVNVQPARGAGCFADHLLEAGLEDRHLALLQRARPSVGVDVDAEHVVADLGQHRRPDQSDIAGSENCNFHADLIQTCSEVLRSRDVPRGWLGRQDSNLGMAVPKTAALPLGDAPMRRSRAPSYRTRRQSTIGGRRRMAAPEVPCGPPRGRRFPGRQCVVSPGKRITRLQATSS